MDGALMPQNIYDDETFFAGYRQLRDTDAGINGAVKIPAMRALLPPLAGCTVLDLGCGFGDFARYARNAALRRSLPSPSHCSNVCQYIAGCRLPYGALSRTNSAARGPGGAAAIGVGPATPAAACARRRAAVRHARRKSSTGHRSSAASPTAVSR